MRSAKLTPAASTRMRTSCGASRRSSISRSSNTSGGPCLGTTIARMGRGGYPPSTPAGPAWYEGPRRPVERKNYLALLLFAATLATVWAFVLILSPFLVPIAWAMCVLTVTSGLHARLAAATGKPRLSAFVMTFAVAVVVVVPLGVVGITIVKEASDLASRFAAPSTPSPQADPPKGTTPAPSPAPATSASKGDKWDDFFASHSRMAHARDK